jgi:hypothetical protein
MVKSRLLEFGASKLKVLTVAALVAASSIAVEVSFAEGPEGIVFTSSKACWEASLRYTRSLDSGKITSFCLANDPARSYSYPEIQEEWAYGCRQSSANTWALHLSKYSKMEFALAKPPSTWKSLRSGSEGCVEKLYWKSSTTTTNMLTPKVKNVETAYTSSAERTITPASVRIVQRGTNLLVEETATLTVEVTRYDAPTADGKQAILDVATSYIQQSADSPQWRSVKK